MHFTQAELKEIHDGLITLFGKKDSDIESLEGTPSADDTVVIMHNNINKKTTVGDLVGHDGPLAPVATTGSYNDLNDKPSLFSGNYNDLTNKPTIPAAQVNADWNASSGVAKILNKPTIPNVEVFEASYITYTVSGSPQQIDWDVEQSKLQDATSGVYHTVILQQPILDIINYDLTDCISFYIRILKKAAPSVIKIEFVSYWDDDHNTYFSSENIEEKLFLYGKFREDSESTYAINSPKGKKTRCSITIINNSVFSISENEYITDDYDIVCECLGSIVE